MHELGIVIEVVKTVEKFAIENKLTTIDTVTLQVGELSSMVPHYIEEVYPIAVENTLLENTQLKIEMLPGIGRCINCSHTFNLIQHKNKCPKCNNKKWEVVSGREFFIKDVIAY